MNKFEIRQKRLQAIAKNKETPPSIPDPFEEEIKILQRKYQTLKNCLKWRLLLQLHSLPNDIKDLEYCLETYKAEDVHWRYKGGQPINDALKKIKFHAEQLEKILSESL